MYKSILDTVVVQLGIAPYLEKNDVKKTAKDLQAC
jgi:hypothetical protein